MPWGNRSRHERGYGWQWEKARERVMKRDKWLCQICMRKNLVTIATECDHILPKSKGGTDDDTNLQALCAECHTEKTLLESGVKRKPRIGLDGWPVEE